MPLKLTAICNSSADVYCNTILHSYINLNNATSYGHVQLILIVFLYIGSPNCANTQIRDITEDSFVVSVQQLHRMWLPVCYHVKVTFYNMSVVAAHNWSFSGDGSVPVTSLQPGKVYNISVTPCNMAGCTKSCNIQSVQTTAVPTGGGEYGMQNHAVVIIMLHKLTCYSA